MDDVIKAIKRLKSKTEKKKNGRQFGSWSMLHAVHIPNILLCLPYGLTVSMFLIMFVHCFRFTHQDLYTTDIFQPAVYNFIYIILPYCQVFACSNGRVSPLLWSRLKYLNNYWVYCHDILYTYHGPQRLKPTHLSDYIFFHLTLSAGKSSIYQVKYLSSFLPGLGHNLHRNSKFPENTI